jgi:hypothetical protein
LDTVHSQPVSADLSLRWHRRQRLGDHICEIELRVLKIINVRGADGAEKAWGLCGGVAIEGLAAAQAERVVDVLCRQDFPATVTHELERLLNNVTQTVLDLGGESGCDVFGKLGNPHRLRDNADRLPIHQTRRHPNSTRGWGKKPGVAPTSGARLRLYPLRVLVSLRTLVHRYYNYGARGGGLGLWAKTIEI